jgi:2,3-bisphosphoglycerate-dependent phosphoglycerate mutase
MELLLIRHALPVRQERTDGPADPGLAAAGVEQAEHLARYLSTESLQAVYSSPMMRAVQTAAPLAAAQGVDMRLDEGVAEFDRNASSYVPLEELRKADPERWREKMKEAPEDGTEFRATVVQAVEAIIAGHTEDRVAIVCHAGVIGAYLAFVLGIELVGRSFFTPNYTSIHRVMASRRGSRTLYTLNETAHLRGTGLPTGLYD